MARILNQQQLLFCRYYALYGGAKGAGSKAARAAGYSSKFAGGAASGLLKRPEVLEKVKEEQKALADKVEMTTTEIIGRYQDMARKKGDYGQATVTEAERALKQLGKYKSIQGFTDKLVIEHKVPFRDWSVEQIDDFIEKGIVPKGKRLPKVEGIGQVDSGGISEKSGESIN